ncbi:MAG: DUF2298 domain-containing protein [Halobacteriaceae archaeon]
MSLVPALLWLAALAGVGLLGCYPAAALFGDGRRGVPFALAVGLATLGLVGYWIGRVQFGPLAVAAGLAVLATLAALARRRAPPVDRRTVVATGVVLVTAYAAALLVRAFDPSVLPHVGEMFLDFGLLASLLRTPVLPPEDVWFAGERVKYYYGAHLLAALLAELTGASASAAYNPAVAGFYATLAVTAFGLAGALGAARDLGYDRTGALGSWLVVVAGNLFTPVRLLSNDLPGTAAAHLAAVLDLRADLVATTSFWYQNSAWALPNGNTSFPALAYVNGNLRPQMVSPVFLTLAAGVLFTYARTPPDDGARRRRLLAAVVPLVGLLAVINTWSVPTVCGLTAVTLYFAPGHPRDLLPDRLRAALPYTPEVGRRPALRELPRAAAALGVAAVVGALGLLVVFPFVLETASGRPLGFLPTRSDAGGFLVAWGGFLGPLTIYLLGQVRAADLPVGVGAAAAAAWLLTALAWALEFPAAALLAPVLLAGAALSRRDRDSVGYEAVLAVAGAGLLLLVELIFVADRAGTGRFNTVVKVAMQVWTLWGPAVAVALLSLVRGDGTWSIPTPLTARRRRLLRAGAVAALLVSLSLFAGLAVLDQAEGDGRGERGLSGAGLNATAFVERAHPGEAGAIRWLDRRSGRPTIVAAPGLDIYQWANAPSSLTGLPTVAGWSHAADYHSPDAYYRRVDHVRQIYEGSPARRAELLARYDVRYIYVGPRERDQYVVRPYGEEPGISVADTTREVVIYAVDQDALGGK